MLYRPDAFEPLTTARWNERRVRDAVRRIVADTDVAFRGPRLLWRAHAWDRWQATSPMKNLYVGAAGVVCALERLRARGYAETRLDLADVATRTLELFRARPDIQRAMKPPEPAESALMTGETGILLVAWRLTGDRALADSLHARVRANVENEGDDVMWGTPGTLVAAQAMLAWTGERRWRAAWEDSAEALLRRRADDGFWIQHLYGQTYRGLGPPHGVVGNVEALRPLLDSRRRERLERETAAALVRSAFVEGGLANWPYSVRSSLPSPDGQIRVQWCAGGPGVIVGAAAYLDEDLLLAGGELLWRAGPPTLEKGPGICHGTAGNGYAFLAAFARTGDEQWLRRARRFAMHALEQVERLRAANGTGRYSLWTGDLGVALYAADCVEGRASYPIFEGFD
ncbi:MAG TPA: LanC-like protein [Gaiellaceae bacterium]|nr:LanC-like protein [Gaiellaceae bacterium]